jgi:hypothetical protein
MRTTVPAQSLIGASTHRLNELIQQAAASAEYLAEKLHLAPTQLDKSYKSLDLVSQACETLGLEHIFAQLYDAVVAYVGEVIRLRVQGKWAINTTHAGGPYPFISTGFENVQYMPLNVVYEALYALDRINFRKQVANEVRRRSADATVARKAASIED